MSNAIAHTVHWPEPRIVGDTARAFKVSIFNDDTGLPIDLGGTTATFKLVDEATGAVIVNELSCLIEVGDLSYFPVPADVAYAGHFRGRFKVVMSDAAILKIGHISFEVCDDV